MSISKYHTKANVSNVGYKWVNVYAESMNSKDMKEAVSKKIGIPADKISVNHTSSGHTDKEPQW